MELNRRNYIVTQMAVLTVPALLAVVFFQVNPYITNPVEEFAGYTCGITGLITVAVLCLATAGNEVTASAIFCVLYLGLNLILYATTYSTTRSCNVNAITVNAVQSLWSVLFGAFWMFAARQ